MVGILLHELVHVFLDIFACQCVGVCLEEFSKVESVGLTGHGHSFIRSLAALQTALENEVGWNVEVALTDSANLEMKAQEKSMADAEK